ncbi:Gfo/Idh/MocA family oxidoreductase [Oceanobacillus sp. FSL K6-3682]|uniref:Gfo/Idh/MocA family protein n=1 Tax=Oceanobacillus sp. FSL K6-3682 TaxID=2921503 RepID=UPI0030D8F336
MSIRVGMIGYQFMGRAHSIAYRNIPFYFKNTTRPVLQTLCGRNSQNVSRAASEMGWSSSETEWEKMIQREDIDLIDIVSPNHTHAEIAIAAAEAGKHVICEKPLATTLEDAKRMLEAVEKAGVMHMVCHNYRFAPAIQLAKKMIEEGQLGKIYHIRAVYLQDWLIDPSAPVTWRLQKERTGSGALGDIGSHIIDLARFLVSEISEVSGLLETFIKERPSAAENTDEKELVTVDDASIFTTKFENGALGVFEASRFATGNRNGNRIEINGEKGSIRWDLENMNHLHVYLENDSVELQGFRTINCTGEVYPYGENYWPPGHILGYEHTFINLIKTMMDSIKNKTLEVPNFKDGYLNQLVIHAVEESHRLKKWVKLSDYIN